MTKDTKVQDLMEKVLNSGKKAETEFEAFFEQEVLEFIENFNQEIKSFSKKEKVTLFNELNEVASKLSGQAEFCKTLAEQIYPNEVKKPENQTPENQKIEPTNKILSFLEIGNLEVKKSTELNEKLCFKIQIIDLDDSYAEFDIVLAEDMRNNFENAYKFAMYTLNHTNSARAIINLGYPLFSSFGFEYMEILERWEIDLDNFEPFVSSHRKAQLNEEYMNTKKEYRQFLTFDDE